MVKVNQKTCIGCGACASTCGEVFEIKEGKSHVKKGQENSTAECISEAIEGCPTNSISP